MICYVILGRRGAAFPHRGFTFSSILRGDAYVSTVPAPSTAPTCLFSSPQSVGVSGTIRWVNGMSPEVRKPFGEVTTLSPGLCLFPWVTVHVHLGKMFNSVFFCLL